MRGVAGWCPGRAGFPGLAAAWAAVLLGAWTVTSLRSFGNGAVPIGILGHGGGDFLSLALEAVDVDGDLAFGFHYDTQDKVLFIGGIDGVRGLLERFIYFLAELEVGPRLDGEF